MKPAYIVLMKRPSWNEPAAFAGFDDYGRMQKTRTFENARFFGDLWDAQNMAENLRYNTSFKYVRVVRIELLKDLKLGDVETV